MSLESISIIRNTDSNFHKLEENTLSNTICHFEHCGAWNFRYRSPISLRYINKGEIQYIGEHSHTVSALNDLFIITEPREIETRIFGGNLTQGFSVFFNPLLIRKNLLRRLKNFQISVKEPEMIFKELVAESITSAGNDQFRVCCENIFGYLESGKLGPDELGKHFEEIQIHFLDFLIQNYLNAKQLKLQNNHSRKEVIRRLFLGKKFIHENFSEKINLGQIAENAFLSKFCFQRYFRVFFSISPTEYLTRIRLNKAVLLLKTQEQSIGSIAEQCGFRSPQYFTYTFKNAYGQPPRLFGELAG